MELAEKVYFRNIYIENTTIYKIVIVEWKSNRFVALKTHLMHPEIVWQKKRRRKAPMEKVN